jgi:hypothetical protein
VRVSELPPLSLSKDWMDRTAWAFSAVLVVVGVCGVLAAFKTLKAIESQAGIMAGQLKTMESQLTAMKESGAQTTDRASWETSGGHEFQKVLDHSGVVVNLVTGFVASPTAPRLRNAGRHCEGSRCV